MLRAVAAVTLVLGMSVALAPASDATPMLPLFKSCKEAHKAGVYNIPKGDPQYKKKQDPHHKGVACEGHPKGQKGDEPAPADAPAPAPADAPVPADAPA